MMTCLHSYRTGHVSAIEASAVKVDAHSPVVEQWETHPRASLDRHRHHHDGGNGDGDDENGADNRGRGLLLLDMTHVHVHSLVS